MIERPFPIDLLRAFSEYVSANMALHFPEERLEDLARGARSAAREFGYADPEAYVQHLLSSPLKKSGIETLAAHLTVGETYFFRERQSFDLLEGTIIPERLAVKGTQPVLRIWSAGCASGEEPYSIAIVLSRAVPEPDRCSVTLLATDINPRAIEKARKGVYGEWSFRNIPPGVKENYFKKTDEGTYRIAPRIREKAVFSYLNLAEDAYPSLVSNTNAMDIIFCRNVLMYFSPEQAGRVVRNFHRCLVDGGWLIVSPTEASATLFGEFERIAYPEVILYRKGARSAAPIPAARPHDPSSVTARHGDIPAASPGAKPPREEKRRPRAPASGGGSRELAARARAHADRGELREALECCEKAISAEKLDPVLHYLKGILLQELGESEKAAAALRRVLYLDHDFVLAHFSLGILRQQQGRRDESNRHLNAARLLLERKPKEEILPESGGLTSGRLLGIIQTISKQEVSA